jgi:3-phenylpropionate/cinnamic acid dioxygenase small subunit
MGPLYAVENIQRELKNSVKNVNFQLSRSRLKTQSCFFNNRIFDYKSLLTSLTLLSSSIIILSTSQIYYEK